MKYFYDTEFIDNGNTIELLSIGIVAEDGREYYAIVDDIELMSDAWYTRSGDSYWLRYNVLKYLPLTVDNRAGVLEWDDVHLDYDKVKSRETIAREITSFLRYEEHIEYWAWYAAYDHVVFSQLFGRMLDLPMGFPMYTNDIKQEHQRLGFPRIPEQAGGAHNALEDARWNKSTYEYLKALDGPVDRRTEGVPMRSRVW